MPRIKPRPFELFCAYYLGLDENVEPRFFNMNSLAQATGLPLDDLIRLMERYHLDAPTMRHVPFNVSKAHADCQDLAFGGNKKDALRLARKYFEAYIKLLKEYDEKLDFETLDYDDFWADGPEVTPK